MDYYEVLKINREATQPEIKKAFRKLAMKYHPDKNPGNKQAESRFKEINEAYEVLSDSDKKSIYDRHGQAGLDPRSANRNYRNPTDIFGEMFGNFHGFDDFFQSKQNPRNQKGSDIHIRVSVSFKDIAFGSEKVINYQTKNSCEPCRGTGSEEPLSVCSSCGGTGQIKFAKGFMNIAATCQTCGGTGKVIKTPCRFCHGKGFSYKSNQSTVKIPKGLRPGQRLRVDGAGNSDNGINPGNLYVDVQVDDNQFGISGDDLVSGIEIDCINATLGCEILVQTLDGEKIVKIPAGIQNGNKIRLPSLGMPTSINSTQRGNLLIEVKVFTLKNLPLEARELLKQVREKI